MLVTQRLRLVPSRPSDLHAALAGHAELGAALGARVPATWPPEHIDDAVYRWILNALENLPEEETRWGMYFILLPHGSGDPLLIGTCGFKGPPSEDGTVEIGYSIVSEHQRRRYASEAAQALIDHAFADRRVERVTAETLVDGVPSQGVLRVCGFTGPEPGSEPGVVRFTRVR